MRGFDSYGQHISWTHETYYNENTYNRIPSIIFLLRFYFFFFFYFFTGVTEDAMVLVESCTQVNQANESNGEEEDDDDTDSPFLPSTTEALNAFDVVFKWLEQQPETEIVQLLQLKKMRDLALVKRAKKIKQTKISDYFQPQTK
uniref:Centromere protein CENP-B C-terminal domain-containing protein n=1 Tax=Cacopsylla melanoneura TaxID=428564 RepID=A0A8D9BZ79_9HEMI